MAKKGAKPPSRTVNKSAKTGRFVSDAAVKKNPSETYQQTVKKKP